MFVIEQLAEGDIILRGRLDAASTPAARATFEALSKTVIVRFDELAYISSAGLGLLLATQKRLRAQQEKLILCGLNDHLQEIFHFAGFDLLFDIEP